MPRSASRSKSGSSYSRSRSRGRSKSRSKSYSKSKSRSRSRSRSYKGRGRRSYSRSYSKSYSRSRSRSPYYRSKSRSRSRSPYYRRRGGYGRRNDGYYRRSSRSPLSNRKRHVGDRDAPPSGKCLGIFGLSLYTTEREVKEICDRYGDVDSCQIVYDHATGRSRGFAFVYFKDEDCAVEAKERLNGQELDGRRIRVDFSITQRAHTPTPGVYMGKPSHPRRENRDDRYAKPRYSKRSYSRSRSRSPRRW